MKIAYVLNSANIGGANRSMENLWEGLKSHNISPFVICPQEGLMWDRITSLGIPGIIKDEEQPAYDSPFRSILNWVSWHLILRKKKIALIHTNSVASARAFSLTARSLKIPLVCHLRYLVTDEVASWSFKNLPKPDCFIYTSHKLKSEIYPFFEQNHSLAIHKSVYNAVDIEQFQPGVTGNSILKIGIIGNLFKIKGHEFFLEMANILTMQGYDLTYEVYGDDVENSGRLIELKNYSKKLCINERVTFHGYAPNISKELASIDIVVCTSLFESFGRCLIEAMAAEKPVVATRVGGIPEVVSHGETGYLVPSKNPEALAENVALLVENVDLRVKLGKEGRKRVKALFSTECHSQQIFHIYEQLLKK